MLAHIHTHHTHATSTRASTAPTAHAHPQEGSNGKGTNLRERKEVDLVIVWNGYQPNKENCGVKLNAIKEALCVAFPKLQVLDKNSKPPQSNYILMRKHRVVLHRKGVEVRQHIFLLVL